MAETYCGSVTPPNLMSQFESVTITFHSDDIYVASGFLIDYSCKNISCDGSQPNVGTMYTCCTTSNPCAEGHGDCDKDSECQGELLCGSDNCVGFSKSDADCCYMRNATTGDLFYLHNVFDCRQSQNINVLTMY